MQKKKYTHCMQVAVEKKVESSLGFCGIDGGGCGAVKRNLKLFLFYIRSLLRNSMAVALKLCYMERYCSAGQILGLSVAVCVALR